MRGGERKGEKERRKRKELQQDKRKKKTKPNKILRTTFVFCK